MQTKTEQEQTEQNAWDRMKQNWIERNRKIEIKHKAEKTTQMEQKQNCHSFYGHNMDAALG